MPITIRSNCFETNSSSTHSLTIDTRYSDYEDPRGKTVYPGEFGWEHEKFNDFDRKASYLWTLALNYSAYGTGVFSLLRYNLDLAAEKLGFTLELGSDKSYYYVDHGGEHWEDMLEKYPELSSVGGIIHLLTFKGAWIFLGNDNQMDPPNFRETPFESMEKVWRFQIKEFPGVSVQIRGDESCKELKELACGLCYYLFENDLHTSYEEGFWQIASMDLNRGYETVIQRTKWNYSTEKKDILEELELNFELV